MKIIDKIDIEHIYDKNLNFLIGSGASSGLFPTLAVPLDKWEYTYETLLDKTKDIPDDDTKRKLTTLIFMAYYHKLISPVQQCEYKFKKHTPEIGVLKNYYRFLKTILQILGRSDNKICNMFTTNYDGCIPFIADKILQEGDIDFSINDGTSGFFKKQLEARNYNKIHQRTGMFSEYKEQLPTINYIPLHGSAYWRLESEKIFVDYQSNSQKVDVPSEISEFCDLLNNENKTYKDLVSYAEDPLEELTFLSEDSMADFLEKYEAIPIVNPTKEKFYETVIKEHYYQMLRLMSYELEKEQTVFITFGFSFADEHILSLVKRSLSNPNLLLYVCCYNKNEVDTMKEYFSRFDNVYLIDVTENEETDNDTSLDFNKFNNDVFTLKELIAPHQKSSSNEGK